jgi:predicted membrane-bound spermidine synthase
MAELARWETFYEIVGSAAGALIGLQFVVMTLVAQRPSSRSAEAAGAFATPTTVHLGTALLLSALLMMPWESISPLAALSGTVGVAGAAYTVMVVRRMRRQTAYLPEFEDWLFHALLPLLAYVILALSAFATAWRLRAALFGVGATALLLLFVGIHNAWDSTSYHVFVSRRDTNP